MTLLGKINGQMLSIHYHIKRCLKVFSGRSKLKRNEVTFNIIQYFGSCRPWSGLSQNKCLGVSFSMSFQIIRPTPRRAIDLPLNDNLRFVMGKSNTDPRRDPRKHYATDERPKSHSPSTTDQESKRKSFHEKELCGGSMELSGLAKPLTIFGNESPEFIKDRTSPPEKGTPWKNTSWSSADSIQHFPERDTSNQVLFF